MLCGMHKCKCIACKVLHACLYLLHTFTSAYLMSWFAQAIEVGLSLKGCAEKTDIINQFLAQSTSSTRYKLC